MNTTNANDVSLFKFGTNEIRVVTLDDAPWFVATDICKMLDIRNVTQAVSRLSEYQTRHVLRSGLCLNEVSFPNRGANIVSEAGLYALVLRSDKKEAMEFQNWVTRVVLPAIPGFRPWQGRRLHPWRRACGLRRSGWRDDRGHQTFLTTQDLSTRGTISANVLMYRCFLLSIIPTSGTSPLTH